MSVPISGGARKYLWVGHSKNLQYFNINSNANGRESEKMVWSLVISQ